MKELIPELFYLSEMFKNENNYDLGTMSENGHQVDDVVLPNWAKVSCPFTSILPTFHLTFTLITHYVYTPFFTLLHLDTRGFRAHPSIGARE